MEKRNLQISFEQAKNWYNGTNEELKQLALETFPELAKKELPKTWEELKEIKGYFVNSRSYISTFNGSCLLDNRNLFATIEQAEASIALAQLSQLREVYRQGWVPGEYSFVSINNFLSFQDEETRDLFLENFKDLIEKASPLMS